MRAAWVRRSSATRGARLWNTPRVADVRAVRRDAAAGAMGQRESSRPIAATRRGVGRGCASCGATRAEAPKRARCSSRCARLHDWRIAALRARAGRHRRKATLLLEALAALERLSREQGRKPLRAWLDELEAPPANCSAPRSRRPADARTEDALRRLGARSVANSDERASAVAVAAAQDDEHELELIAAWCRSAARTRS